MTAFEKAWYDHVDYSRRIPEDSIRLPGYTGPSGQDRRSHFSPDWKWIDRNPLSEGGWQQGVRREVSRGRKTDSPSGWAVSGSDGYTDEEKRRYKLDLALARLPLELNRPLMPREILELVEHEDDMQYLVDTGVMPSVLQGGSLEQMISDVKDGTKSIEDVIGEAIGDGWVPPQFAGEAKDEYYMPHAASDRLTMLDRMRAVINARLMDVPREQLLTLVDDKSMAPKVMEDWHDSTKPIGGFGHGDWSGHTPRTAGALVRDTKNLSRLDGPPNIFDDIMGRIGKQPELKAMFRRLLSSEAADLLNTMDDRRELDRIDPRGMPFSNAPAWMGPVQGPMEDFGDVEIRGQDPFSEEFQIMNRSSDSFEDAWSLAKDFYLGSDDYGQEGGFHSRWGPTFEGSENVRVKQGNDRFYYTGVNLNHPSMRYKDWLNHAQGLDVKDKMSEAETIQQIIDILIHEEGHEAVYDPLREDKVNEYKRLGIEPYSFSAYEPDNQVQERGAMIIEGLNPEERESEMRRRGFFG